MYKVGTRARLTLTLTDLAGALANGTVSFVATRPDGTTTSPAAVNDGTGLYHADLDLDQAGHWSYAFSSTGAVVTTESDVIDVLPLVSSTVISLADAKAQLNITNTAQDAELRDFLYAATAMIEDIVGPVAALACDEWHDGGGMQIVLDHAPIVAVTTVLEAYGSFTKTLTAQPLTGPLDAYGYTVDLAEGLITRRSVGQAAPFAPGRRNVHVVYTAGRTAVSENLNLAGRLLVQDLWRTQRSASGNPAGLRGDDENTPPPSSYEMPGWIRKLVERETTGIGIA